MREERLASPSHALVTWSSVWYAEESYEARGVVCRVSGRAGGGEEVKRKTEPTEASHFDAVIGDT